MTFALISALEKGSCGSFGHISILILFSFNFGHLLIPGRDILPITDLEIPNFEWHDDLVKKKHFAVQQDFARVKGDKHYHEFFNEIKITHFPQFLKQN